MIDIYIDTYLLSYTITTTKKKNYDLFFRSCNTPVFYYIVILVLILSIYLPGIYIYNILDEVKRAHYYSYYFYFYFFIFFTFLLGGATSKCLLGKLCK